VIPGVAAGVALWLAVSLLVRAYLGHFRTYNATFGSLGAVMVLLLWFNLSSEALLAGAEVNVALERK